VHLPGQSSGETCFISKGEEINAHISSNFESDRRTNSSRNDLFTFGRENARIIFILSFSSKNVVVIGGSAGAIEALRELVGELPGDLEAALFVAVHIPAHIKSHLPEVLKASGGLRAAHAKDAEPIEPGRIYVAPPDHHLLLEKTYVSLWKGPKESNCRPAINTLFRSAAFDHGERVVGVISSGMLDDGSAGLWLIKKNGGAAIVQDPDEAAFSDMPRNALSYVAADYVAGARHIAEAIVELSRNGAGDRRIITSGSS